MPTFQINMFIQMSLYFYSRFQSRKHIRHKIHIRSFVILDYLMRLSSLLGCLARGFPSDTIYMHNIKSERTKQRGWIRNRNWKEVTLWLFIAFDRKMIYLVNVVNEMVFELYWYGWQSCNPNVQLTSKWEKKKRTRRKWSRFKQQK